MPGDSARPIVEVTDQKTGCRLQGTEEGRWVVSWGKDGKLFDFGVRGCIPSLALTAFTQGHIAD